MELTNCEEWHDIKGYDGYYQVSNLSRVRSIDRVVKCTNRIMKLKGIIMTPTLSNGRYLTHRFSVNAQLRTVSVHRLVAETFIPNPQNKREVNHINGIKTDNRIENLEWCTSSENTIHAFSIGIQVSNKLENHFKARPIIQLTKSGTLVEKFDCSKKAVLKYGFQSSAISKACNGKLHTAYGFIWQFEDTLTNYERWQLKKHKGILNEPAQSDELENGRARAEAFERWVHNEAEYSFTEQQF